MMLRHFLRFRQMRRRAALAITDYAAMPLSPLFSRHYRFDFRHATLIRRLADIAIIAAIFAITPD
jgi:hypothetical protein